MVTVRVGHNKQEFCIHEDILCSQSRYFAKALSGQFLEARTRVFEFEDVHPVQSVRCLVLYWQYRL